MKDFSLSLDNKRFSLNKNRYSIRGVSSKKEDVHQAIKNLDKGVFPGAFCKAVPSLHGDAKSVSLMHADGAGTKSSLAYLYWKETEDLSVFRGIAQDSLIMNVDDLLCVGSIGPTMVSSTIGRNKLRVPGEVIEEIIEGTRETIELLNKHGGEFISVGGETADLGDIVKTLIVDTTVTTEVKKKDFIDASRIKKDLVIVGLASYGQASYEKEYNAGIGSNGLTLARHELFKTTYREKYPETFDGSMSPDLVYCGQYGLFDKLEGTEVSVGKALLSPTRTYFPVIKKILAELSKKIVGIVHCTGGGQVKCKNFGHDVHFIKNNFFPFPPLFERLAELTDIKEMFEVFNCGHRLEIYLPKEYASSVIDISRSFNVDAQIIGHTEELPKNHENKNIGQNKVTIEYGGEEFVY